MATPTLEHTMASGFSIKAWLADHENNPHIMVHWRHPNGKPCAQPFMVPVDIAPAVFAELVAFSELAQREPPSAAPKK